jgi:hypothetical protein
MKQCLTGRSRGQTWAYCSYRKKTAKLELVLSARRITSLRIVLWGLFNGLKKLSIGLVASRLSNRVKFSLLSRAKKFYTEVESMSSQAKREYLFAIVTRYRDATKDEKTRILDEFCKVCSYTRKHAIWLLSLRDNTAQLVKRERKKKYPESVLLPHVKYLWFAMEQVSAKRMKKAFCIWLPAYRENEVTLQIKSLLEKMSVSTLDRLLSKIRSQLRTGKGLGGTRPAKYFQNIIPLRTLDELIDRPGHVQADTVLHCGSNLLGQFAHTLCMTDIDSTWTEARAMELKSAKIVVKTIQEIEDELPFPILSMNTDCGNEFLNHQVHAFCRDYKGRSIKFTRSRPYKKNDNCYIEQKNFTHVREVFGYERIDGQYFVALMNEIYTQYWLPLQNFFIPNFKLQQKIRVGSRIKKFYGEPKTAYERLIESTHLSDYRKRKLKERYEQLDPFVLSAGLKSKLAHFASVLKQSKIGAIHVQYPSNPSAPYGSIPK